MPDKPGDYYVAECVAWINSVPGLSDADRATGRDLFAVLLAHHDLHLYKGTVPYVACLQTATKEFDPAEEPAPGCRNCFSYRAGMCIAVQPPEAATLGWCFAHSPRSKADPPPGSQSPEDANGRT